MTQTIYMKPRLTPDGYKGNSGQHRHCIFCNDWKPSGRFQRGAVAGTKGPVVNICGTCAEINDRRNLLELFNQRFDRLEKALNLDLPPFERILPVIDLAEQEEAFTMTEHPNAKEDTVDESAADAQAEARKKLQDAVVKPQTATPAAQAKEAAAKETKAPAPKADAKPPAGKQG